MFYIPNIVLVGYGRQQTFQFKCIKCKDLYFNFDKDLRLTDLFCDDCVPDENLLKEDNKSEVLYLGNILGWVVKSSSSPKRTFYNFKKVLKRDGYTCQYCGYSPYLFPEFRPLHIDHIKPFVAGGNNSLENLVVACQKCNAFIHDKWFISFQEKKDYIIKHLK